MKCGEVIYVKDPWGTFALRFIAQCGGRFMVISNSVTDYRNGYLLSDWHGVLREMVAQAMPAKLIEKAHTAESTATGLYANVPLTYPLSIPGLASVLGVPADEVRAQLADLAVQTDPP